MRAIGISRRVCACHSQSHIEIAMVLIVDQAAAPIV
jgi:hypothetical protein